jgi:hypothetical protein
MEFIFADHIDDVLSAIIPGLSDRLHVAQKVA